MKFQIHSQKVLADGTLRFLIGMENNQLIKFGYILESLEGWCNYTTPHKTEPVLQVDVSPDFVTDFDQLLKELTGMDI